MMFMGIFFLLILITFRPFINHVISGTGFEGPDIHTPCIISPTLNICSVISIFGSIVWISEKKLSNIGYNSVSITRGYGNFSLMTVRSWYSDVLL